MLASSSTPPTKGSSSKGGLILFSLVLLGGFQFARKHLSKSEFTTQTGGVEIYDEWCDGAKNSKCAEEELFQHWHAAGAAAADGGRILLEELHADDPADHPATMADLLAESNHVTVKPAAPSGGTRGSIVAPITTLISGHLTHMGSQLFGAKAAAKASSAAKPSKVVSAITNANGSISIMALNQRAEVPTKPLLVMYELEAQGHILRMQEGYLHEQLKSAGAVSTGASESTAPQSEASGFLAQTTAAPTVQHVPVSLDPRIQALSSHMEELKERRKVLQTQMHHHSDRHAEHVAKHLADVADLKAHLKELEDGKKKIAEEHDKWAVDFGLKVKAFDEEMCADPRRYDYPMCQQLRKESKSAESTEAVTSMRSRAQVHEASPHEKVVEHIASVDPLSWKRVIDEGREAEQRLKAFAAEWNSTHSEQGAPKRAKKFDWLNWNSLMAWENRVKGEASGDRAVLRREDIPRGDDVHWLAETVPKVACFTPISGVAADVEDSLRSLIEDFRRQDYEGPKELVLVYQSKNDELAELVKTLSDGTSIHGLPAFGDGDFPSTATFRYTMWKSRADVVARWDLNLSHSPQRLSSQVRAMAESGRPACLLGPQDMTAARGASDFEDTTSIVGVRTWMREHWFPLLHEERGVFTGALHRRELVRLAMPELETTKQ